MFNSLSLEITLGNVLTIASILGSWVIFTLTLKNKIDLLTAALTIVDRRITSVEEFIKTFSNTSVQLAKQEVHFLALEQRVHDIERTLERRPKYGK